MGNRPTADKIYSAGQTPLMIVCKIGDVAAVREMLEWSDDDEEADISITDENGQNALSIAKQSNNAEIVAMIEQKLFLRAVKNGDIETVKTYLTPMESNFKETDILTVHREHNSEQIEIQSREDNLIKEPPRKRFKTGIETEFIFKDSITHSVYLEAVTIAQHKCHGKMLDLLLNDDRFTEYGQSILHKALEDYLDADIISGKLSTIQMLLKSAKLRANVLNLQIETMFEIVCKWKSKRKRKQCRQIDDLLRVILQNGIDLNDKNKNGKTLLMLACENRRADVVHSLLKLASREFVLDMDAVDNSGKTALMKAKEKNFFEIVVALLKFKFTSAVKDGNADIVKSMIPEFRNTSDIFVKSRSSNQYLDDVFRERETKYDIWLEAMYIAMENYTKHSEEILKLLLGCDILLSQEIETGYSSFYQLMHSGEVDDDKKLRLTELLLKSGKINVNDRDEYGRTALHWAGEETIASLLVHYGADVNRKDNEGKTALMPISDKRGIDRFPVLRTLLEEAGTLVDLDAMDCDGRTALMHAVMLRRSHDVELLINAGSSVNISDHLGFTALHHAFYGNINHHFEFPRDSEELKKLKEMTLLFDAQNHEQIFRRNEDWCEERKEIVEILLRRPDINVNAISFEKFSPLDIAEGQIKQTPSSFINALKDKGTVLNVFRQTESQSTSEFKLGVRCRVALHRFINKADLDFLQERLLTLIETFKEQIVSGKDQRGRTALHLTAIYSYCQRGDNIVYNDGDCLGVLAKTFVTKLISLGCSVNERDNFGRTPLHYANEMLWNLFISKGADESIEDNHGYRAIGKMWHNIPCKGDNIVSQVEDQNDKIYLLRLINNKQMKMDVQCARLQDSMVSDDINDASECGRNGESTPELIWKTVSYGFRHHLFEKITKEVTDLMNAIAKEIESLDPRLEIRPEFVGSSNEGTKIGYPDEFDFCFVLTKISGLCEVSQSPELPTGFVRLKRRPTKVGEESDFDSFFGEDGILNTEKLKWQFAAILSNALVNIDRQQSFEWILEMPFNYGRIFDNIGKVLNIKMIKPLNFFSVDKISIDIVSCIHIDDWWPDDAISNVSDEIKEFGCSLVFDRPQKLYPWVPYSELCARVSFAKSESHMIKQSCENAREAYMIGKTFVGNWSCKVSKYTMKNCLLYCIEALSPSSEKAFQLGLSLEEMKCKFHKIDRYLWLKCLMKCHLEFVAQDFCPCYFLPTFSSPIEGHVLKIVSFDWISDRRSSFPRSCKNFCAFYLCTSNDVSESSFQLPAPDPLWERFDRKQLIASLCEIAYK